MELLLVRHALPVRRELVDGPADPELSGLGHEQAQHLARYLADESLDALYSSPMRRAVETAAPLADVTGLDVMVRDGVAEWDQNSPDYVPVEELKASNDPRWHAMLRGDWEGELSPAEFAARTIAAIEGIVADHRGERVAIVCHGGVINAYLAHVLGLANAVPGFFYPNYTSINRVAAASSGQRMVVTINETSHLRGTGLPMGVFQSTHARPTAQEQR